MYRKGIIIFFLTLLGTVVSDHASAQFWKGWFHKEKPKHKAVPHKATQPKPPVSVAPKHTASKKLEVDYPATQKKARYRVDVFTSLYLDELVNGNKKTTYKDKVPEKALTGIDFYEGVKIAADTLNNMGYDMDIYVHDMTDITQSAESLINSGDLDSTDLIIGAVQSHEIAAIARFAKREHINFISALSPSDGGVKDDPYFTLIQPSLQSHCEWIMNAVSKKYNDSKISLFYRTNVPVDESAYKYVLKNEDSAPIQKVLCNVLPTKEKLNSLFDSTQTNVIVVTILDNAFSEALLKQLYVLYPTYRFEVYGMPSWKTMGTLRKADAYPNIGVNITDPFYFDLSTPTGQYIESVYKKEYGGRPGESVYRGYEIMYWYAQLLKKHGTIFNKSIAENPPAAPFTKFEIKPKWDKEDNLLYDENRHLYLYRYQSGSYLVQQ